jgi:hypothetical protein
MVEEKASGHCSIRIEDGKAKNKKLVQDIPLVERGHQQQQ